MLNGYKIPGGVEMTDIVHYKIPFLVYGRYCYALFIQNELKQIFKYRYRKIEERFGLWKA